MCKAIEGIRNDAKEEGFLKAFLILVKDGTLTISDAAKKANMTVSKFEIKTGLKSNS